MNWLTQIFVFGFAALACSTLSLSCVQVKKPAIGLVFAALELFSASMSSWAWMDALRVSGKGDWFLLGILGYTPIGLIFVSMFVVGIWCVAVSIRSIRKQKEPTIAN